MDYVKLVTLLAALASIGTQLTVFLRWIYRRMRDDEINRKFVTDMATNHLPHLHSAMKQLAAAQGVTLEEPPPIQFVEFPEQKAARPWHRMT